MTRRVVAGQRDGKAVIISDGVAPRTYDYKHIPGMTVSRVWSTPRETLITRSLADTEPSSQETNIFPAEGETRFLILTIPPDSRAAREGFDPAAAGAEMAEQMPDMIESTSKYGHPFHRSDTIDYVAVLDGEVVLELDDGVRVTLGQGDVVVQNGTLHAWRNESDRPVTLAVVLAGARRHPE